MDKKVVVIDRSKWFNGALESESDSYSYGYGTPALENKEGYSCCLGFVCRVEGFDTSPNSGKKHYPSSLPDVVEGLSHYSVHHSRKADSDLSVKAAKINDDKSISNATRERKLRKLFKEHPDSRWILSFRGKYPNG